MTKKQIVLITLLVSQAVLAQTLSFSRFKEQVLEKDPKTQALQLQWQAAQRTVEQAELMTSVHVFANAAYLDDQQRKSNPGFQGDRTVGNTLGLGLQQQTPYGLKWSLSHNVQKTDIQNASTQAIPEPKYYENLPKLELSLPLWRNWLGEETQGDQKQLRMQSEIQAKKAEVDWINQESEIEMTYYRLLSRQEAYQIQQDSLERAEKILKWSQSRFDRNLIDEGDLVQSKAAVKARELDVATALTDLQVAARDFNQMRGLEGDKVVEKLQGSEIPMGRLALKASEQKQRLDLEIQKNQIEQLKAQSLAQKEKIKPSLDLQVQGWTQGRGLTYTSAAGRTFGDKDYLYVGLAFSMPLNQGKAARVRSGYSDLARVQDLQEQSRLSDVGLNWLETVDRADQIRKQIEILRELERLQKKKADSERDKLNRGRSTTFQVLSFEQDYFSARNRRIAVELEARQFINSLALYR